MQEMDVNLRSLLACEALVDDLGIAIDAQVVDGEGVGRRGRAVRPPGELPQNGARRAGLPRESLHLGCVCAKGREGKRGQRRAGSKIGRARSVWSG